MLCSFDRQNQKDAFKLNDEELNYLSFSGQITKDMMESHLYNQFDMGNQIHLFESERDAPAFNRNVDLNNAMLEETGDSNDL